MLHTHTPLDCVNFKVFFSCDSSSIQDNVGRSVGLSVGLSVSTSFKVAYDTKESVVTCCMIV